MDSGDRAIDRCACVNWKIVCYFIGVRSELWSLSSCVNVSRATGWCCVCQWATQLGAFKCWRNDGNAFACARQKEQCFWKILVFRIASLTWIPAVASTSSILVVFVLFAVVSQQFWCFRWISRIFLPFRIEEFRCICCTRSITQLFFVQFNVWVGDVGRTKSFCKHCRIT